MTMHRLHLIRLSILLLLLAAVLTPRTSQAQAPTLKLPPGFVQETVAQGLEMPTAFALAPDGRIFIAEKPGRVRVIYRGMLQETPFLDISDKINTVKDRGLTGIAVHPRWPAVPYIYLAYVYEPPEAEGHADDGARVSRITRVSANPSDLNVALPESETVLVGGNSTFDHIGNPDRMNHRPYTCVNGDGSYVRDCIPNEGNSHTVDQLVFGPDGALYVSSGDGINYDWANLRAQSVDSLAGKILRIDPISGNGYANNPFYDGDPGSNRSKVFALGLRNPWRITFAPNGSLFVADVGKDKWEEINRTPPGANLGWPCFEGPQENAFDPECDPVLSGDWPVTHAVYSYPHGSGRGAAIGGDFVKGRNFPAIYRGAYFYSDFNSATLDYLTFDQDGSVTSTVFAAPAFAAVQMTFAADGSLYVLYILNGALARIRYVGGENTPPVAVASASATSGSTPLEVRFSAGNAYDPDGDALRFQWTFGDGESSTLLDPVHVYTEPGRYVARLTVNDLRAATSDEIEIRVGEGAPDVQILEPAPGRRYRIGDTVTLQGRASDAEDGPIGGAALTWEALLHHNDHTHFDFYRGSGEHGSFVYADHDDNSYLELCLTASDSSGLESRQCVDLRAQETQLGIQSVPSGLPISYNGSSYTTPFRVRTYVNAERTLEAPPTAGDLRFQGWSDGGDRRHAITVSGETTLVATYADAAGNAPAPEENNGSAAGALVNTAPTPVSQPTPASTLPSAQRGGTPLQAEAAPPGGARILLRTTARYEGYWSVVQWQGPSGGWQDVEGWRGNIEDAHKRWWVSPDAYGAGPFRWLLYDREGGTLIAASEAFHLPESKDQMLVWSVP